MIHNTQLNSLENVRRQQWVHSYGDVESWESLRIEMYPILSSRIVFQLHLLFNSKCLNYLSTSC